MSEPFTSFRVCRFLLICALAGGAIYLIFVLLTNAKPRQGVQHGRTTSSLSAPMHTGPAQS